jgi:hypothetical protein
MENVGLCVNVEMLNSAGKGGEIEKLRKRDPNGFLELNAPLWQYQVKKTKKKKGD